MEGSGTDKGIIRSNSGSGNNFFPSQNRYTPIKTGFSTAKFQHYETPTSGYLPRAEFGSDYASTNTNFYTSNLGASSLYKAESPRRDYSSLSRKQPYESMLRSQFNTGIYDSNQASPNKKELIMQLESVKKQRDYFETEYRRAVREYHEKNLRNSQLQGAENYGQDDSDLRREINAVKIQHQGETKRLNETLTTLKLENAGLRNLRSILEGELESLKSAKQQADLNKDKAVRLEVENASLQNQVEASNSLLKSKAEEFKGLEAQYKSQLNEKDGIVQALREKLSQVELTESIRTVLCSIEVERLHTVIEDLYSKITGIQQDLDSEIQNVRDEDRVQLEAKETELKASLARSRELDRAISDEQAANKRLREEINRVKLQESELEKDILHWKERYKIIEGSHKYLVDAIEKMRAGNPTGFKSIFPNTGQQFSEL